MKTLILFSIFLLCTLLFSCQEAVNENSVKTNSEVSSGHDYNTLDLEVDQCVPGGFSENQVNAFLEEGYTIGYPLSDSLYEVTFCPASTPPYNQRGYLEPCTQILYRATDSSMYIISCGNDIIPGGAIVSANPSQPCP